MKKKLFSAVLMAVLAASISLSAFAAVEDTGFTDVSAEADYAQAVIWCRESGLLYGVGNDQFNPDGTLTRAMLATTLYRAAGEPAVSGAPAFDDTQAGSWYADAVAWVSAQSLIVGYGNGHFGTNDAVSVEMLNVILDRYMGLGDTWQGDSALAVPATRAEIAVALYQNLAGIEADTGIETEADTEASQLIISVGGQEFTATLADTQAAKELLERLPLTLSMQELHGNEKYYYLDQPLPTNASNPGQIQAGDLMLYGNNCLVLFYESFSTQYSYTRIGHIDNVDELRNGVGSGSIQVKFTAQ